MADENALLEALRASQSSGSLSISSDEAKSLDAALRTPEFRSGLMEYMKEMSDPAARAEQEAYLAQLEAAHDVPAGMRLVHPVPGFALKARLLPSVSEEAAAGGAKAPSLRAPAAGKASSSASRNLPVFINIVVDAAAETFSLAPAAAGASGAGGAPPPTLPGGGSLVSIPHLLSPPRYELDGASGERCITVDFCVHPETLAFAGGGLASWAKAAGKGSAVASGSPPSKKATADLPKGAAGASTGGGGKSSTALALPSAVSSSGADDDEDALFSAVPLMLRSKSEQFRHLLCVTAIEAVAKAHHDVLEDAPARGGAGSAGASSAASNAGDAPPCGLLDLENFVILKRTACVGGKPATLRISASSSAATSPSGGGGKSNGGSAASAGAKAGPSAATLRSVAALVPPVPSPAAKQATVVKVSGSSRGGAIASPVTLPLPTLAPSSGVGGVENLETPEVLPALLDIERRGASRAFVLRPTSDIVYRQSADVSFLASSSSSSAAPGSTPPPSAPSSLIVRIHLPLLSSAKGLDVDVHPRSISLRSVEIADVAPSRLPAPIRAAVLREVARESGGVAGAAGLAVSCLYELDLPLPAPGILHESPLVHAKFDKDKKTLQLTLPMAPTSVSSLSAPLPTAASAADGEDAALETSSPVAPPASGSASSTGVHSSADAGQTKEDPHSRWVKARPEVEKREESPILPAASTSSALSPAVAQETPSSTAATAPSSVAGAPPAATASPSTSTPPSAADAPDAAKGERANDAWAVWRSLPKADAAVAVPFRVQPASFRTPLDGIDGACEEMGISVIVDLPHVLPLEGETASSTTTLSVPHSSRLVDGSVAYSWLYESATSAASAVEPPPTARSSLVLSFLSACDPFAAASYAASIARRGGSDGASARDIPRSDIPYNAGGGSDSSVRPPALHRYRLELSAEAVAKASSSPRQRLPTAVTWAPDLSSNSTPQKPKGDNGTSPNAATPSVRYEFCAPSHEASTFVSANVTADNVVLHLQVLRTKIASAEESASAAPSASPAPGAAAPDVVDPASVGSPEAKARDPDSDDDKQGKGESGKHAGAAVAASSPVASAELLPLAPVSSTLSLLAPSSAPSSPFPGGGSSAMGLHLPPPASAAPLAEVGLTEDDVASFVLPSIIAHISGAETPASASSEGPADHHVRRAFLPSSALPPALRAGLSAATSASPFERAPAAGGGSEMDALFAQGALARGASGAVYDLAALSAAIEALAQLGALAT